MKKLVRAKICGITNFKDAKLAYDLGASALGFIFYKKSPRYCCPAKAAKIISKLPPLVTPVGVFVDEKPTAVLRVAKKCHIQTLQFHGNETPQYCRQFKGYTIIKAIRVHDQIKVADLKDYKVSALLLDTYQRGLYGGTGKTFNWIKAKQIKRLKIPIILSGGLTSRNVACAINDVKPYALDISSGIELRPGKKSPILLKSLFKNMLA